MGWFLKIVANGSRIASAAFELVKTITGSRFFWEWLKTRTTGPQGGCPRCGPVVVRITEQELASACETCPIFRSLARARRGVRLLSVRGRRRPGPRG